MTKAEQREKYKIIRHNVKNKGEQSYIIETKIIRSKVYNEAKVIALYSPIKDEVNVNGIAENALLQGKTVVYPKVINNRDMVFIQIESFDELCVLSKFGVREPRAGRIVQKEEIDMMIIPGIGFDHRGYRIGYGKGYYDNYLRGNKNILKIGVTFKECVMEENIDSWDNDLVLDVLVIGKNK